MNDVSPKRTFLTNLHPDAAFHNGISESLLLAARLITDNVSMVLVNLVE